jgi:hypothetical protein
MAAGSAVRLAWLGRFRCGGGVSGGGALGQGVCCENGSYAQHTRFALWLPVRCFAPVTNLL